MLKNKHLPQKAQKWPKNRQEWRGKRGLQQSGHVDGYHQGLAIATKVFGVDKIWASNSVGVFAAKLIEGSMGVVAGGFNFNRCEFESARKKEVHLVSMF